MTRGVLGVALASAMFAAACDRFLQLTTVNNPVPDAPADVLADAPPNRVCFSDDFNTLASSSQWTYYNGTSATAMRNGSQLVVNVPVTTGDDYAGANFAPGALVGMMTVIQAAKVVDVAGSTSEMNWGVNGGSNSYALYEQTSMLIAAVHENGVYRQICFMPYDPTSPAYQYWRIRHDAAANQLYFEAGPDGQSWTQLCHEMPTFPLTGLTVGITCGAYATTASAGQCLWDNFEQSGPC